STVDPFNGIKGCWKRIAEERKQLIQFLAFQHRKHNIFFPVSTDCFQPRVAKLLLFQEFGQGYYFLTGNDPDNNLSISNALFDNHPHQNAHSKTTRIGDIAYPVVKMFKYLTNGQKPNERFKEAK